MRNLIFLFQDSLSHNISSLRELDKESDIIVLSELREQFINVPHHKKKLVFIIASMRSFAEELKFKGVNVIYRKIDSSETKPKLQDEIEDLITGLNPQKLIVTEPSDYKTLQIVNKLKSKISIPIDIREDDRFICTKKQFKTWLGSRNLPRMEYFYREMRLSNNILMNGKKPIGGKWNFDKENREPPKTDELFKRRITHKISDITLEVIDLVNKEFVGHFGDVEPFNLAIDRSSALVELNFFIKNILPDFGPLQDAMLTGEAFLNHSLLSTYINIGLLSPMEVIKAAEKECIEGNVDINSAEGFIRQILGWREYVRGIYWSYMPEYSELDYLESKNDLPAFYWNAKTDMKCIAEAVMQTKKYAYSHHIQRLMVTGNFALISGLDVKQVQEWYLSVYADAYEWVEMPNTLGMSLYGDGGIMASKPYASSGKYINKMSNFCKNCKYSPADNLYDNSCPFNSLYWDFISRNQTKLRKNQRLTYVYSTYDKFDELTKNKISAKAKEIIEKMNLGSL